MNCTFKYLSSLGFSALKVNKFLSSSCQLIFTSHADPLKVWCLLNWVKGPVGDFQGAARAHLDSHTGRGAVIGIPFQGRRASTFCPPGSSLQFSRKSAPSMVTCFWSELMWELNIWKAGPRGCINPHYAGSSHGSLCGSRKRGAGRKEPGGRSALRWNLQVGPFTPVCSRLSLNETKISPNHLYLSSVLLEKRHLTFKVVGKGKNFHVWEKCIIQWKAQNGEILGNSY